MIHLLGLRIATTPRFVRCCACHPRSLQWVGDRLTDPRFGPLVFNPGKRLNGVSIVWAIATLPTSQRGATIVKRGLAK
ncbi:MAG: hypothetical protein F6K09_11305 [Merismopedia sp. SIO2A8]|nr:hypothetical protein [Merismopedia sp. SIO2A8]